MDIWHDGDSGVCKAGNIQHAVELIQRRAVDIIRINGRGVVFALDFHNILLMGLEGGRGEEADKRQ